MTNSIPQKEQLATDRPTNIITSYYHQHLPSDYSISSADVHHTIDDGYNNNSGQLVAQAIETTTAPSLTAPTPTTAIPNFNMNIQPTGFTKNHLINDGSLSANDELSMKKRREELTRRPSYRKIFNDLTGLAAPIDTAPASLITNQGNLNLSHQLQRHLHHQQHQQQQHQQQQPPHQHHLHQAPLPPPPQHQTFHHPQSIHSQPLPPQPHHHPQLQQQQQQQPQIQAATNPQVHQLMNTTTTPTTSPPITPGSGSSMGEEAIKKRDLRLQKNREAAKECRRKKKEYIKCLEHRVAVLETQNKALIDELKTLKDLYCKSANE